MSEGQFKFPEWQVPLQELLQESDTQKLIQKAEEVEAMFLDRLQQLNQERDGHEEKDAISDALRTLLILKRDKLGFPDWK